MEVYMDDMVVQSHSVEEHIRDLTEVFEQIRRYNMWLNLVKCTFVSQQENFWVSC